MLNTSDMLGSRHNEDTYDSTTQLSVLVSLTLYVFASHVTYTACEESGMDVCQAFLGSIAERETERAFGT